MDEELATYTTKVVLKRWSGGQLAKQSPQCAVLAGSGLGDGQAYVRVVKAPYWDWFHQGSGALSDEAFAQ
jgi:hypothetical protein